MPYEKLEITTLAPVFSWANHPLGLEETKMAKNVERYILRFSYLTSENISMLCKIASTSNSTRKK